VLQMMHDDLVMRGFFQHMIGPMPLYAWLTAAIMFLAFERMVHVLVDSLRER
jgi:hypothetical protein